MCKKCFKVGEIWYIKYRNWLLFVDLYRIWIFDIWLIVGIVARIREITHPFYHKRKWFDTLKWANQSRRRFCVTLSQFFATVAVISNEWRIHHINMILCLTLCILANHSIIKENNLIHCPARTFSLTPPYACINTFCILRWKRNINS